jgi:hypothetical protein
MEPIKFLEKHQRFHIQIGGVKFNMSSCRIMSQNKNLKKKENPRLHAQNKLDFWHPFLQSMGSFSHVATYKSSSKNT